MWKGIYYIKKINYKLSSYLNALGRGRGVKVLLQWFGKKKAAGQNIHYLFTFKACFKVELFGETAAQVALRQWISEGYSKGHLFIYFNITGHGDPGTSI